MINATLHGYEKMHLENVDINRLAEAERRGEVGARSGLVVSG